MTEKMTEIIPRELIKHLEWVPGQKAPKRPDPVSTPQIIPVLQNGFSIDTLIKEGKPFYCADKDGSGKYIGVAVSFQQAFGYACVDGVVASMPYLVAGKAVADKKNYLWKDWFTALSEENIGIDKNGVFVKAGNPVVVTVHGGGILDNERIMRAYADGLTPQNAAKYTEQEFDNLLKGVLPNGESIQIYTVDDVKKGNIPNPFGRYAVVLDFETAKATDSGYYKKKGFMKNPLVFVRVGTLEHLENYFNKAKDSDGDVGNHHRFGEIDFNQPQGRLLFVDDIYYGLSGNDSLNDSGRFVGVAPEAPRARKIDGIRK